MLRPDDCDVRSETPFRRDPTRSIVALGAMYMPLSFVSGLAFVTVPAQMRESGHSLVLIGFQTIVMLPWLAKIVWAPYVERYRLPALGRHRTAAVAASGVAVVVAMMAAMAFLGDRYPIALLACLLVAATAAATSNIACDGFTIDACPTGQRSWANTAQVSGAYLGIALSGGLFLIVAAWAGWIATLCGLVVLALILPLPFLRLSRHVDLGSVRPLRPDLRSALANRKVRLGLVIVLACSAGSRLSQSMIVPLLVDRGFTLSMVGLVDGVGGVLAGLFGTLCAGFTVRRIGSRRAIAWALGVQAACLAALALAGYTGTGPVWLLGGTVMLMFGALSFASVALYAELMGYTSSHQPGVDFSVFQCSDAGLAMLAGPVSGFIATHLGYVGCFSIAAGASATAAGLAPSLISRCRSIAVR